MPHLRIRMFNAQRKRLDDRVDIDVRDLATMRLVAAQRNVDGTTTQVVPDLTAGRPYSIQVFPLRHRPVGHVALATAGPPVNVHVFCPVHPARVSGTTFPAYTALAPELRTVLEGSTLEADAELPGVTPAHGRTLYGRLEAQEKAGLLNLFTKMQNTSTDGRTMWSFVRRVYRFRGDRIFADVDIDFRDHVKSAVASGAFEEAGSALHTPPPGFEHAGSFKHQLFSAGVLQLTFFASVDPPLGFRVDADIDDAGGLGHVFQVLRNWLTKGATSPYDIHEILVFHQLLEPGYELEV